MPIKMYNPNGTVQTWEDDMMQPHVRVDHQNEQPSVTYYREEDVKSPDHYAYGGIEAIDYIKAKLSPEEFSGYCWGNVLKYISRFNKKDGVKDLRKAKVYLDWLVDAYEKRLIFPHKVVE